VLHRSFGDAAVMSEQLEHVEETATKPNIFIQVLPSNVKTNPGIEGPLRVIYFPDAGPAWYTEGWYVGRMSNATAETEAAITNFDLIRASALSPEESVRLIRNVRQERYGSQQAD
ncbi:MAG: Scr1 family TA system antitoxin-like transcriptional regulator, partial [Mycobacterium sp.]